MTITLSNISLNTSTSNTPSWTTLFDLVYPKGAYYLSHKSTSPATLFGNTNSQWTRLDSAVVRTSDNTNSGGTDADRHQHLSNWGTYGSEGNVYLGNGDNEGFGSTVLDGDGYFFTFTTWNDKVSGPHRVTYTRPNTNASDSNNLPKYQNCYGWYRNS